MSAVQISISLKLRPQMLLKSMDRVIGDDQGACDYKKVIENCRAIQQDVNAMLSKRSSARSAQFAGQPRQIISRWGQASQILSSLASLPDPAVWLAKRYGRSLASGVRGDRGPDGKPGLGRGLSAAWPDGDSVMLL
uniref:AATF-Che1 domain-containing protein n=1 Tax=Macrostomum lignano TaxID=282301 RepID=A0A1I8FI63_9PLAT